MNITKNIILNKKTFFSHQINFPLNKIRRYKTKDLSKKRDSATLLFQIDLKCKQA